MNENHWRALAVVLFMAVGVVMASTTRDYGITWDEEYHRIYGDAVLSWYSSGFSDNTALEQWHLYYYGGFFDSIGQLAARYSQVGLYETRHILNVLFGLVSIAATYGIGALLRGPTGGFFSALFLVLTPVYYGHIFNNPKDIPFAAMFAVSVYLILVSLKSLPLVSKKVVLLLGLSIGLALGVRVAGVILLAYVALFWGIWAVGRYWGTGSLNLSEALLLGKSLGIRFLLVWGIAWAVMLVFWPWAQVSPLLHPWEAIVTTASFDWPKTVLFGGMQIPANDLPPSYIPTWFAISMPEFYFLALLCGCLLVLRSLFKPEWIARRSQSLLGIGLLVLVVSLPVVTAALLRSTLYDGLRQVLFVIPALAALAGISLAAVLESKIAPVLKLLVLGATALTVGMTVFDMAQLHPYQYTYFNRAVAGGIESASTRYETDYYGVSYREGVLWLIDNYPTQPDRKVRVANSSWRMQTAYYLDKTEDLRKRFAPVQPFERPDIYLTTTRWDNHLKTPGEVLHVVSRKGVALLYVIEVDQNR